MTVPIWPVELWQKTLADAFQSSARGSRLQTGTDVGPGKLRRRGPALKPVSCGFFAETDELMRFYRFFEDETNFGVLPFLIPDQQLDGFALLDSNGAQLLDDNDVPLFIESWWLVQFGQKQPSDTAITGLLYSVQFDLIVLP